MTYYDCAFYSDGQFLESVISAESKPLPLSSVIYWNLLNESSDFSRKRQVKALKRAFLRIGQVIPIRFRFKDYSSEIQITITDNDDYFKIRPNALAYAFVGTTTQEIDLVFNEAYNWVLNREVGNNQYDLEIVAIHEILHVLGLNHSFNETSVMYPNYQGIYDMNNEDVKNLQDLWGIRGNWSRRLMWLKGFFQRLI